jgi:hypothetical protein
VFVPKHYEMDPATDDLMHVSELRPGMRILVEENGWRVEDPENPAFAEESLRADKYQRWCTVTKVFDGGVFITVYDDGMKIGHVPMPTTTFWYVKKDSIPVEEVTLDLSETLRAMRLSVEQDYVEKDAQQSQSLYETPRDKSDDCVDLTEAAKRVRQMNPHGPGSPEDDERMHISTTGFRSSVNHPF